MTPKLFEYSINDLHMINVDFLRSHNVLIVRGNKLGNLDGKFLLTVEDNDNGMKFILQPLIKGVVEYNTSFSSLKRMVMYIKNHYEIIVCAAVLDGNGKPHAMVRHKNVVGEYGFMTNQNRFVNRKEAYKIAYFNCQCCYDDREELYSEDLY